MAAINVGTLIRQNGHLTPGSGQPLGAAPTRLASRFLPSRYPKPLTSHPFPMDRIETLIHTLAVYEANGFLVLTYVAWEHLAAFLTLAAWTVLLWRAPIGQRAWLAGADLLCMLAAFLAPSPSPFLLAAMSLAGAAAVLLDRFNPDGLRWRIAGGLTLYALAALAALGYEAYLQGASAAAWAQGIGSEGEAAATLATGRAFVETLATWGLWLILPLGYFSLLAQTLFAHPPLPQRPDALITAVRTRDQG